MTRKVIFYLLLAANIYSAYGIWAYADAARRLEDVPPGYAFSPAASDLTVVEFFDYACNNCKAVYPILMDAIKRDGKVRYIPRPLPSEIKDARSKYVEFAYAAGQQGKFMEANERLLTGFSKLDEKEKAQTAAMWGLDSKRLETDSQSKAVQDRIADNRRLFSYYARAHLPVFVIGGKVLYAPKTMPTVEDFLRMFGRARKLRGE